MDEREPLGNADVLITGVGSATPRAVAALAQGVELPIEAVVDAVYRAPARLFANLAPADARRLVDIVRGLGLCAEAVPAGSAPPRGALFDVAGHLLDAAQAEPAAAALARVLGMPEAQALEALLNPPGMLLGNVTAPTVEALRQALPAGAVELTAANAASSSYALFAAAPSAAQCQLVRALLPGREVEAGSAGLTLFDLTRTEADTLWRRLQPAEGLRIVNQAFLRFTLVLVAAEPGAAAALQRLAGVPPEEFDALCALLPVPVERHVPFAALQARLAEYAAGGLGVRAELATFAAVQLEVLSAPPGLLRAEGFGAASLPFRTPAMVEPRARMLRARLEAAGADVLELA